ncbi:hypothetical protein [uncultured Sunxiuqinia sp.]|uniref:hypothetical protein n=1 Tax=uncultured Sunxiuqinia sp. TaxID=1573825 RepID=UPI002AA8C5CB|nr:hypothetical protein [uncultured Sunxiuqinia sp.]
MEYFECNYSESKVEQLFNEATLIEKKQRSGNGQWVLNFKLNETFKLYLSSDRGIMDVYITKNDQPIEFMLKFSQIRELDTKKENIDFLFDFLSAHKDKIFKE